MRFHYFCSGATAWQHRRAAARSNYNLGKRFPKKHVSDTRPTGSAGPVNVTAAAAGARKRPRLLNEGLSQRIAASGGCRQGAATEALLEASQVRAKRGHGALVSLGTVSPGGSGCSAPRRQLPRMSRLIVSLISHGD